MGRSGLCIIATKQYDHIRALLEQALTQLLDVGVYGEVALSHNLRCATQDG